MSMNEMPTTVRPTNPPSGASGPPPGSQTNRGNTAKAMMELTMMSAQEFIALGKAILSRDPQGAAMAQAKLRQIQSAVLAVGGQGAPQAPQGRQTGVPTPVGRPTDAVTGRPY